MKTTSRLLVLAQCGWTLATGHAQNTNPPQFFQPSKAAAGAPVVLKWASDPLTVYSVEYNTMLLSNDWHLVQENFPAQGTNTWWSDTGNESLLSPRLSSGDPLASYRFYRLRVERYMSNSSPVTASIGNISEGAVLSGLVDVQASGAASQGVISAKLYVDGDFVGVESGSMYTFPLETRYYPNGPHRLSVVVQDAGGLESTEESNPATGLGATYGATNVAVVFSNQLSSVRFRHKAFRPDLGQTQHVSAVWTTVRLWSIDITPVDDPSTVLRSFSGDGKEISVIWDGRNTGGGQIVPQAISYHLFDLGPGTAPPGGGGGGPPPAPDGESAIAFGNEADSALFPASPWEALAAGLAFFFVQPPPMPPVETNGRLGPLGRGLWTLAAGGSEDF